MSRPPIRSYVRREGRITRAQARALEELWPVYGIEPAAGGLDFAALFGRRVPVVVELGFGNGASLVAMAAENPQCDFLGVEVYRPGVGSALLKLKEHGLTNVRLMTQDAQVVVGERIGLGTVSTFLILFPDPWPKKRHHKRRLLKPEFVKALTDRLELGGRVHVATDWEDYAVEVLHLFDAEDRLRNLDAGGGFVARPGYRHLTKYETRGRSRGHRIRDIMFQRVA